MILCYICRPSLLEKESITHNNYIINSNKTSMIKRKLSVLLAALMLLQISVKADEGMWLPMFIKRLNYQDLQSKGLQLTPEEIYSVNNSSLKDAIVRLGRGFCTGEIISSQGLMLTNHHCGYSTIQANSTVEHDYLTDGFWAMSKEEELPAGFSVSFLVKMEDVTKAVTSQLNEKMSVDERNKVIAQISDSLEKKAIDGTHYEAQVKSFYKGNEFYMFIYETFQDVRLVGAPPSSIGKFGGDTDNWMWPRHTGDFTLFRVYAGPDNKPAEYSKDNKPYQPKHHLPISLDGVQQDDFAMIFGYPGSTDRYLTSYGVKQAINLEQPARVKLRRKKLDIYEEYMNKDNAVRIKYASKYAGVSNYWKYFIGQTRGLKRLKVYDKKKAEEEALAAWINKSNERKEQYGNIFSLFEQGYGTTDQYVLSQVYLGEAIMGIESFRLSLGLMGLKAALASEDEAKIAAAKDRLKSRLADFYKDYELAIDKKVTAALLEYTYNDLDKNQLPEEFKALVAKNKNDFTKLAEGLYAKSALGTQASFEAFIDKASAKSIDKDPIFALASAFYSNYMGKVKPMTKDADDKIETAGRLHVKALREMNADKFYAPDANSTMRFTYGQVRDYYPADAVYYKNITTVEGILEKEDPSNPEFVVPEKLKQLIQDKDFGQYASNGTVPVAFISNNDITGGNSGSPVINGKGQLIGTAFDGNWEAMSGDIAFEHELQRTISVDIRYTLFIIDKFAGAKHLIDEMTIVKSKAKANAMPQMESKIESAE